MVTRGDPTAWAQLSWLEPRKLVALFPNKRVWVYGSAQEQRETILRQVSYQEYVDYLESEDRRGPTSTERHEILYLGEHPHLAQRIGIAEPLARYVRPLVPRAAVTPPEFAFWMGPKGSHSGLHADYEGVNIICQIYGRKRVYVIPPEYGAHIPRAARYDAGAFTTSVDLWDERSYHGALAGVNLKANHFDLEPGDILAIPRYSWHAAQNESISIAASYRTETPVSLALNLWPRVVNIVHRLGLYKKGNCTCHLPGI